MNTDRDLIAFEDDDEDGDEYACHCGNISFIVYYNDRIIMCDACERYYQFPVMVTH